MNPSLFISQNEHAREIRVAQAASLHRPAACRTDGDSSRAWSTRVFSAGCRKLQAGSLRYPEET